MSYPVMLARDAFMDAKDAADSCTNSLPVD